MIPRIPEKRKLPGLHYAVTDDGVELPIIDITHPAFALGEIDPGDWAVRRENHLRMTRRHERNPAFLRRFLFGIYSRHSILLRGVMEAQGSFLSALNTYLMKLGPENLGKGYAGRIDRKVAASFLALKARLRLRDVSRALALSLAPLLTARPGRPVHMVNIAGGPASDCLNALILLSKDHRERLDGRSVCIHVLDLHREAPNFGRRALDALQEERGPLHGLDVRFAHHTYDWSDTKPLTALLEGMQPDAIVVGSSEGGLFVYGTDDAIFANLEALHKGAPEDFVMVGSVIWDDALARANQRSLAVRTFTPDDLERLVHLAGWVAESNPDGPGNEVIRLRKHRVSAPAHGA
jgi:hypothetical protein